MNILKTPFSGLYIVDAKPVVDARGKFARLFCQQELAPVLSDRTIKQINYSQTAREGTIRGMHFQYPPKAETKLIRCIKGSVYDIAVDLRKESPTFLQWYGVELSSENMKMVCIPEGFAHGFQALDDHCEMLYLHTEYYSPSHEGGVRYNDVRLGIAWPMDVSEISDRDAGHPVLKPDYEGLVV